VEVRFVLFALVYLLLRRLVQSVSGSPKQLLETEVEVVVLRHQLRSSSASLADRASAVAIACSWPR
jgi:hypothetical protein